ncbi:copper resistance CopC family protein [Peribacillus glennii]|uniref:Copper resistance protein CopC n=1 Tax=Peribacillus glennii TaxID=2303991 RepID=A0A372L9U4_9BACI|nr:copper resistance CopC family protein [Peribacillus glennii]RFU62031.1 copper resistance protein CopC [Peribacillus glennii]
MLKKLVLLLMFILLVPNITSAHTGLSSSSPKEGQAVTEDLKEITLTYETKIEKLSSMKLKKAGTEIPLRQTKVLDNQMIGILSEPLSNGPYVIEWKIVGADGHPITGKVSFKVQLENNEVDDQEKTDKQSKSEETEERQPDVKEHEKSAPVKESNNSRNTLITVITSILVLVLLAGLLLLLRKKR